MNCLSSRHREAVGVKGVGGIEQRTDVHRRIGHRVQGIAVLEGGAGGASQRLHPDLQSIATTEACIQTEGVGTNGIVGKHPGLAVVQAVLDQLAHFCGCSQLTRDRLCSDVGDEVSLTQAGICAKRNGFHCGGRRFQVLQAKQRFCDRLIACSISFSQHQLFDGGASLINVGTGHGHGPGAVRDNRVVTAARDDHAQYIRGTTDARQGGAAIDVEAQIANQGGLWRLSVQGDASALDGTDVAPNVFDGGLQGVQAIRGHACDRNVCKTFAEVGCGQGVGADHGLCTVGVNDGDDVANRRFGHVKGDVQLADLVGQAISVVGTRVMRAVQGDGGYLGRDQVGHQIRTRRRCAGTKAASGIRHQHLRGEQAGVAAVYQSQAVQVCKEFDVAQVLGGQGGALAHQNHGVAVLGVNLDHVTDFGSGAREGDRDVQLGEP